MATEEAKGEEAGPYGDMPLPAARAPPHPQRPHLCNDPTCEFNTARNKLGKAPEEPPSAPMFVEGRHCSSCSVAVGRFGVPKQRHHCRFCGYVVCDACSPNRLKLNFRQYLDQEPQRVCTGCFQFVEQGGTHEELMRSKEIQERSAPQFLKSNECQGCGTGFLLLFDLRHHCRACGLSFCEECCNRDARVPFMQYWNADGPVRVCDGCFRNLPDDCIPAGVNRAVSMGPARGGERI